MATATPDALTAAAKIELAACVIKEADDIGVLDLQKLNIEENAPVHSEILFEQTWGPAVKMSDIDNKATKAVLVGWKKITQLHVLGQVDLLRIPLAPDINVIVQKTTKQIAPNEINFKRLCATVAAMKAFQLVKARSIDTAREVMHEAAFCAKLKLGDMSHPKSYVPAFAIAGLITPGVSTTIDIINRYDYVRQADGLHQLTPRATAEDYINPYDNMIVVIAAIIAGTLILDGAPPPNTLIKPYQMMKQILSKHMLSPKAIKACDLDDPRLMKLIAKFTGNVVLREKPKDVKLASWIEVAKIQGVKFEHAYMKTGKTTRPAGDDDFD